METWKSLFNSLFDNSSSIQSVFETGRDDNIRDLMCYLTFQFVFMGDSVSHPPVWGFDDRHCFPDAEATKLTKIWLKADARSRDELTARLLAEYWDCFESEDETFEYIPLVYQLYALAAGGATQLDLSVEMNWGGNEDHYIPNISFDSIACGEGNLAIDPVTFKYVRCNKCSIKGGYLSSFMRVPPVNSPICDIDIHDKADRPVVVYYYDVCPKIINITSDTEMPQIEPMSRPNLSSCKVHLTSPVDIYWYPREWEKNAIKRAAQLFNQTIPTHNNLYYLTFHLPKAIKPLITNPEIKDHIVYR